MTPTTVAVARTKNDSDGKEEERKGVELPFWVGPRLGGKGQMNREEMKGVVNEFLIDEED